MSRVFITGSADGLGRMAGAMLAKQGHAVTLHARNDRRADDAWRAVPAAEAVVTGDLATITGMRQVAKAANAAGRFDAVIHNAGIGYLEPRRVLTEDGLEHVFAVNVLAPYLLTALIDPPARLVYLSSGMHRGGGSGPVGPAMGPAALERLPGLLRQQALRRGPRLRGRPPVAGRRCPTRSNRAGWRRRWAGAGAPDDLSLGPVTQAWLAVSDDPAATVTAGYFYHQRLRQVHPAARDAAFQDELLDYCASLTGTALPARAALVKALSSLRGGRRRG